MAIRFRNACVSEPDCHTEVDRKSTRLNSSHSQISYAVFCLKKKIEERPALVPVLPALTLPRYRRPVHRLRSRLIARRAAAGGVARHYLLPLTYRTSCPLLLI